MTTRLETIYKETVVPQMMEQFGYENIMQVPRISTRRSWKMPLPT